MLLRKIGGVLFCAPSHPNIALEMAMEKGLPNKDFWYFGI
jgi:hypothetical protein